MGDPAATGQAFHKNQKLILWLSAGLILAGFALPGSGVHAPGFFGNAPAPVDPMQYNTLTGKAELPLAVSHPDLPAENLPDFISAPLPPADEAGMQSVPALFVRHMPQDMAKLPTDQKKQLFIRIVLPLILQANQDIREERALLAQARDENDLQLLEKFAQKYRLDATMPTARLVARLEKRVQEVPVSLAVAQAAVESGWGSSRFTLEGNALFGQWAWRAEAGIKPREASNEQAVIRSFPNLFASVRAYMINLNSHWAYQDFRDLRARLLAAGITPRGRDLTPALSGYAETGFDYVELLNNMITQNQLESLDDTQLVAPDLS